MSTSCWESAIIQQPIDRVWAVLRPMEFVWNPRVMSVRAADEKGVPNNTPLGVGEERVVHYRDTTKQRIRLLALSDARYSVSWTVVESTPAVAYSAVVHTVTLRRVTSTGGAQGAAAGAAAAAAGALPAAQQATFIEWNAEFSADATTAVTEDARFKIADAFAALREESAKSMTWYTTAAEAAEQCLKLSGKKSLAGTTVLLTGGNTGLGLETARVLIASGAKVVVTVRDEKKAEETVKKLTALTAAVPNANAATKPEAWVCALDSFKSIRAFAEKYLKSGYALNTLILNAGVMALPKIAFTEEKFELQIGVNHIGHFLLTQLLTPALKRSASAATPGRVVVLSSGGHNIHDVNYDDINWSKNYEGWAAYGSAKSANIVFANALNARFAAEKVPIFANSLHPGVIVETDLWRHLATGGPASPLRLKNTAQGAATTIVAAMHPRYASEGGVYLDDCQPKAPNPYITAPGVGDKLWALTEKLIAAAPK